MATAIYFVGVFIALSIREASNLDEVDKETRRALGGGMIFFFIYDLVSLLA